MLNGKNLVLCVTGGISAYKSVYLASKLKKLGANVITVMSKNAVKFVSPLTFKSVTANKVTVEMFDESDFIPHIKLSDLADIVVVAPATANIIAKAACGIADDMISSLLLSVKSPILMVPAMNTNMYQNKIFQDNLDKIVEFGFHTITPAIGELACGTSGIGRFPEIDTVVGKIEKILYKKSPLFSGKKVVITLGGTIEDIDPVRYICNGSSGKMGLAFAEEFILRGAEVSIIAGNVDELALNKFRLKFPDIDGARVRSAKELKEALLKKETFCDVIFMCAAVADYKPAYSENKIKKTDEELNLKLFRTEDVVGGLNKSPNKLYIAFSAESENLIANAYHKLLSKKVDFIIANETVGEKKAIGGDNAEVVLLNRWNDNLFKVEYSDKRSVSIKTLDEIEKIYLANRS
ncbi:MAG TPA: bifunctional phosphopantothenoylcysteine decarboxylase/phosphopantothenate--cysteine ligase CoaBC [Spirochaetota bacterium]|jgi:phosphopantothenoylcysteine decarboxylase/phosphopantothenate--cysteine ligase|nr:MAG: Coenzyme A biosynthesis bifunctional protein CoaBC [Spirochaetes bacterium ADurb.Bin133]HNZ27118.1 bifunctional phosphopantothenoylcysteine decarboxylase/phosphopantothenate--cysteine ligase CoaBC [Spirochaetota bacterium]HPY86483.1 bifunctional phosphopantothenoylcysteine decarboxylase/phosphopantothenate--cysteine ligase CoaBC [Spirochaetota bacterium]HQB60298.1 bifunctional phosphopantothenoylcysteine decarboxylase/phosphopantothenate--cysteine ligase CoaBC [Spirochaetota bacterium]